MTVERTVGRTERFDDVVAPWLDYQRSPMGRLRTELFWRGLRPHMPVEPCDVLDIGGGSGELTEIMAHAGHRVTLVDSAQPMLDAAQARMRGLDVAFVHGHIETAMAVATAKDAGAHEGLTLSAQSFDVITCHSVIEFLDDPMLLIARCRTWLREDGVLSLGFGNQRMAVLQAAIVHKDLPRAAHDLHHEPQVLNRLGKPLRLLEPDTVVGWLHDRGFKVIAENGIRTVTDLIDSADSTDEANFGALLDLETHMMGMPAYARIARFVQLIAQNKPAQTTDSVDYMERDDPNFDRTQLSSCPGRP